MSGWVVDKGLLKLIAQVDAAAPNRSKASDGTIGDAAHQAGTSAHNPEASAGDNPPMQVDAADITHDPDHGADMALMTESIRVSRDRRVKLAIFNRRQFSSYSTATRAALVWGPYSGSDPHTNHAHIEVGDDHNDETQDWEIGIDMSLTTEQATMLKAIHYALFTGTGAGRAPGSLTGEVDRLGDAEAADVVRDTAQLSKLDELLARPTAAAAPITDEQLERVMRRVLGMQPTSPA